MSDETSAMKRRTFLCVLGAGCAATVIPGCGDSTAAEPFTGGTVADHPVGVWKLFESQRVIIGRDAAGFFAFTAVCTDQGTTIAFRDGAACSEPAGCTSQSPTGNTECPLHFSRFDGNGTVLRTPAPSPLAHFQLTIAGGTITVTPSVVVAATTRTAAA